MQIDQIDYTGSINKMERNEYRKRENNFTLDEKELNDLESTISQLGCIKGQTRPDLSFETWFLSSNSKNSTINDIIHVNKVTE